MTPSGIVTFTTDFGLKDTYVGQMKGVALSICPDLTLVDLTHEVPAHDVMVGAVHLRTGYPAFPPGTVHVAVVDPGVGTGRRGVVVRAGGHYFVAPDNGILSLVLQEVSVESAHLLEAPRLRRGKVSPTFEGRDVFAPAAAWIVRGVSTDRFGPPVDDLKRISIPQVRLEPGRPVPVRVLLVDRFGNVTLNLPRVALEPWLEPGLEVRLEVQTPGGTVIELRKTYAEGEGESPFLLFNSADYLEVAIRDAGAAEHLGLKEGDDVSITLQYPAGGVV